MGLSLQTSIRKSKLYKFGLYVIFFVYIFNISFIFLPQSIKSRSILGFIAACYFVKHSLSKREIKIIYLLISLAALSFIIPFIMHFTLEFWASQFYVLNLFSFLGAILIGSIYKKIYLDRNLPRLLKIIVLCVAFNNFVALLGLFYNPVQNLLLSVQHIQNIGLVENILENRMRAIGFGDGNYFHGGAISGLGLVLTIYLCTKDELPVVKSAIIFSIILFGGIFIARTTLIGLFGFLIPFGSGKFARKRFFKFFLILVAAIFLIVFTFLVYGQLTTINIGWAFEIFINYFNSGTIETASSNELIDMWILPNNFLTWLLGDGKMLNSDGTYYMLTDVGILRHIYFWGLVGLSIYLAAQIYIYYIAYKSVRAERDIAYFMLVVFVYFIILNIKGFIDISWFPFLIISCMSLNLPRYENRLCNQ